MNLLEVKSLHTYFKTRKGTVKAVNDVSYALEPGKTIGIVGESGSGKSVTALSLLGLLPYPKAFHSADFRAGSSVRHPFLRQPPPWYRPLRSEEKALFRIPFH